MAKQQKILIIVENPLLLHKTASSLHSSGLVIYMVSDWLRVPTLISRVQPDLILINEDMLREQTVDIAALITGNCENPFSRTMILTEQNNESRRRMVARCSAHGFFAGPLSSSQLADEIHEYTRRARFEQSPQGR